MYPYLVAFTMLALGAIMERPSLPLERQGDLFLSFAAVGLFLFIGLRYQVGGDWINYVFSFHQAAYRSFTDSLLMPDPGYEALNWLGEQIGLGVWSVDLVCAAIFVWGLFRLAQTQPRPWLVLTLSAPYLITVVATGYTRQSVAIGVVMAAFAAIIGGGGIVRAAVYVTVGMLFHRTAIVLLPILSLATRQSRTWTILFMIPAAYGLYATFVEPTIGRLVQNYIVVRYSSAGAAIRIGVVLSGAIVFIGFRKQLGFDETESSLWMSLSIAAFICLIMLVASPSSTVVDRLALYLLPLQAVVLARVPSTLASEWLGKTVAITFAALTLFVWLNYAANAWAWLPYRNYLSELYGGS